MMSLAKTTRTEADVTAACDSLARAAAAAAAASSRLRSRALLICVEERLTRSQGATEHLRTNHTQQR
jgi:hypothetical protein